VRSTGLPRVTLISIEPWDDVWRRNQHLVAQLVSQGLVESICFVEPPSRQPKGMRSPLAGVDVVTPGLRVPKRLGGLTLAARDLRDRLAACDMLWINEPTLGVRCLPWAHVAIYDVTDDWRSFSFPPRILRRVIAAEDRLARAAATVVCSSVLAQRWRDRYGVEATIITNGLDEAAWRQPRVRQLSGRGPHVGYVGTLQADRLDLDLVLALAQHPAAGTVHLVGPDCLDGVARQRLEGAANIVFHGAVDARDVPSWMRAMDVLVSPHRLTDFTMSLDAIKSREYLASGRPVVATPTSGFQLLDHERLRVEVADAFVASVYERSYSDGVALTCPPVDDALVADSGWASRAQEFGRILWSQQGPKSKSVHVET
jgi:teichuronic acid biosynthesis glycosyltransferase TuaH